jgi:flagellar protein FliO/FliZ
VPLDPSDIGGGAAAASDPIQGGWDPQNGVASVPPQGPGRAADDGDVRLGRPHAALAFVALVLACPSVAAAGAFHRDRTPLPASVAGGTSNASGSSGAHVSATGSFARMIVGLAIVIAVIYGVYWLLKAYGRSKGGALRDDCRMSVLATTTLAPNRSLHLVRVGDELVLVGSAEGGVSPLRVYTPDEARRLDADSLTPTPPQRGSFLEELRKRTAR